MRSTRLLEAIIAAVLMAAVAWAATRPARPPAAQGLSLPPNLRWTNQADHPDLYLLAYRQGKSQASLYLFANVSSGWASDPNESRFLVLLDADRKPHESPSDIRPLDPRLKPVVAFPFEGAEPFKFRLERDAQGTFRLLQEP
jgi:hypothetical protein